MYACLSSRSALPVRACVTVEEVEMDRFVVEVEKKVVGIAVRVRGGFRFVCSDPEFRSMDRKVFPRAKVMASRLAELARTLRSRQGPVTVH
jgi:hypothetical protein